ncbi:MAG: 30S ribosomal protein S8 [Bdellovibrionota bacterium]
MTNDQLADFLTRIRNAGTARKIRVDVVKTKMNDAVASILLKEGYVKSVKDVEVEGRQWIRVFLKYENGDIRKPVIKSLRRVSKPGLRRYVGSDNLPKVMSGFGLAILSTSKGVMTGKEAREHRVGGEHLCSVW